MKTATKNIIKTAQIKINDNIFEATRRLNQQRCTVKSDASSYNKIYSKPNSVWLINDNNYNNNNNKNNKYNKNNKIFLLITMTMLMTFLQMPSSTTAATILRVKDARQQLTAHHSSGSSSSSSSSSIESDNAKSNIDDIVEIILNKKDASESLTNLKGTRKNKRHSDDFYLLRHQHESATDLEWANPCSGVFEISDEARSDNPPPSYYLAKLRTVLSREFHTINDTMHAISISDMGIWSKYRNFYSFLPKVKLESSITLKRWYRNMQTYVAAFAYLGRIQYKWDHTKRMTASEITHELNELLLSARSILCEIETTINGSYPHPNNKHKLSTISREAMKRKLRFLTKRHASNEQGAVVEPQMLDLQFLKSKYYHSLRRMWRVIRMKTKRNGQKSLSLGLSNESSSALSASSFSSASVSATIEDLNYADVSASKSQHTSSSRSNESFEFSLENKSRRNRKHHRRHRKQHKKAQKSAELPKL